MWVPLEDSKGNHVDNLKLTYSQSLFFAALSNLWCPRWTTVHFVSAFSSKNEDRKISSLLLWNMDGRWWHHLSSECAQADFKGHPGQAKIWTWPTHDHVFKNGSYFCDTNSHFMQYVDGSNPAIAGDTRNAWLRDPTKSKLEAFVSLVISRRRCNLAGGASELVEWLLSTLTLFVSQINSVWRDSLQYFCKEDIHVNSEANIKSIKIKAFTIVSYVSC